MENEKQSFSEQGNVGILRISIGGVNYYMQSFKNYGKYRDFFGRTAVTGGFWRTVMHEYSKEQYPIPLTYNEMLEFIKRLNELTQLTFDLPSRELWRDCKRHHSGFTLYLKCDNLPLNEWKSE